MKAGMIPIALVLMAWALLHPSPAASDLLYLSNGDRLSGTIVKKEGDILISRPTT